MKQVSKYTKSRGRNMITTLMLLSIGMSLSAQAGIYTVDGNLTLSDISNTWIQLVDQSGAGTGHDQVVAKGDLILDGVLHVKLDGYTPSFNDQFEIMDYGGGLSGTFSSVSWPAKMKTWSIDYGKINPGKVTIYGPTTIQTVELINFMVDVKADHNLLIWQTGNELNNGYFEVEHSLDRQSWESVAQLSSTNVNHEMKDYSYKHMANSQSDHFYRLKFVYTNGEVNYSEIKSVFRTKEDIEIIFYPNPNTGMIYFTRQVEWLEIYDSSGKMLLRKSTLCDQIDVSHLPSGQYYLSSSISAEKHQLTVVR